MSLELANCVYLIPLRTWTSFASIKTVVAVLLNSLGSSTSPINMGQPVRRYFTADSYTIGWICALPVEQTVSIAMLDEVHAVPLSGSDDNTYTFGQIGAHNVVVATMPEIGNNNAATVATHLLKNFPSIRFCLMVGIGGGIPVENEHDIRLGDVVVSNPTETFGGVIQYDLKSHSDGRFERTGTLNKPPAVLVEIVLRFRAQHMIGNKISENLSQMLEKHPAMKKEQFFYQGAKHDILCQAAYHHQGGNSCSGCDPSKVINRTPRKTTAPTIHYGIIGSANLLVNNGVIRERLREDFGIICVEMEAAGVMDEFPCLVIRGICDYADSHKNNRWRPYATATAAAYAKELLSMIQAEEIHKTKTALQTIQTARCGPGIMVGLFQPNRLSKDPGYTRNRYSGKDFDVHSTLQLTAQLEHEFHPNVWGAFDAGHWHGILACVFSICAVITRRLRWQLQKVCASEAGPGLQLIWCNQALGITLPIAVTLFRLGFCYCIARIMKNNDWVDKHLKPAILCCLVGLIIGSAFVRSATDLFVDVAPLATSTGIVWGIIADRYL